MARAKNTSRAEARRRHRTRTLVTAAAPEEGSIASDAGPGTAVEDQPSSQPRRPFRFPDVRGDLRALPGMFRTRKRLWIPFVMLLVGFALAYLVQRNVITGEPANAAVLYVTLFFSPQSLFTFFLGGFFAPRASYLIGFLLGVLDAALWGVLVVVLGPGATDRIDPLGVAGTAAVYAILFGTLAAAFAAWYRDFLRSSQERARRNRMVRDQERARKAKEQERAARAQQRQAEREARSAARRPTP